PVCRRRGMIIVRVELWSAISGEKTELARMVVDNVGGNRTKGNYRCRTLRGRSADQLDRSQATVNVNAGSVTRGAIVRDHLREKLHVWHLVAKALSAMGYGQ